MVESHGAVRLLSNCTWAVMICGAVRDLKNVPRSHRARTGTLGPEKCSLSLLGNSRYVRTEKMFADIGG